MTNIASIGRTSIPAEFQDLTSDLLLIQPEPQYLHARLILSAVNMKLSAMAGLSLPIPGRGTPSNGSPYIGFESMMLELADPIAQQAVKVVPDFQFQNRAIPNGHTIRFNRPAFTDSTYTEASRIIPANSVISTTPITVGSEQVALTVKRLGGPYSNAQSAVAPFAIDNFDAMFSLHAMPEIAELHFTRDFHKTIDSIAVKMFDTGASVVYPDGMTTNDTSQAVGDFPMDWGTVLKVQKTLDDLHIPTFSNGRRILVLTTHQGKQLKQDVEYLTQAKMFEDTSPILMSRYIGTAGGFDIYTSTTLTQTNNSSSVPIQYGQAFGPGALGVGPASMPRVWPSTNDNFGQTPMAVWLWYVAMGILNDAFVASVRSS